MQHTQPSNHLQRDLDLSGLNFRNSPTYKLPLEILGEIFQFVSPKFLRSPSPLLLSRVCSRWRNVAVSTPEIWRLLVIGGRVWSSDRKIDMLDHFIHNSGGLGLDVRFYSPQGPLVPTGEHSVPDGDVLDLLFTRHPSKLEFITFCCHIPEWVPYISAASEAGHFTRLKRFEVISLWWKSPLLIPNAPQLHSIRLSGWEIGVLHFPWTQIRRLTLTDFDHIRALDVIAQCTNVEFLEFSRCWVSPMDYVPPQHITLPHLQQIKCAGFGRIGTFWIKNFTLPSLKTLIITPMACEGVSPSLPSTLTFLHLSFQGRNDELLIEPFLRRAFPSLINLESLVLFFLAETVDPKILDLLVFHSDPIDPQLAENSTSPQFLRVLPRLSDLNVEILIFGVTDSYSYSVIFPPMLKAVQSRRRSNECTALKSFTFTHQNAYFPRFHFSALLPEARVPFISGLKEMICDGLEVTLNWHLEDVTRKWLELDD